MLIGLISDTHIGYPSDILPPHIKITEPNVSVATLPLEILEALRGVDLILHAGDIYVPSVLEELESVAPVLAAWGDDDIEADFGNDNRIKDKHTLTFDGVTIWLTHVRPNFVLIDPNDELYFLDSAIEEPEDLPVPPDIIIHGHTHFAVIESLYEIAHDKDILIMNPGSATFPNYKPRLGSVGLLTINSGKVETRLVHFD